MTVDEWQRKKAIAADRIASPAFIGDGLVSRLLEIEQEKQVLLRKWQQQELQRYRAAGRVQHVASGASGTGVRRGSVNLVLKALGF